MTSPGPVPPEPPVGTWMKDKYGGVTRRQHGNSALGGGWGLPGMMPFGKWEAMWEARGPYVECGEWGRPLEAGKETWHYTPKPAKQKLTITDDGDERLFIKLDGVTMFEPNHEDEGWDGMTRMIELVTKLAEALGIEVENTQNIV
jgi:hypothetical protein